MGNRHKEALLIQGGAVNPSGIAHAIIDACSEARNEPGYSGSRTLYQDPAIRLMVQQLAFLVDVHGVNDSLTEYGRLTDACKHEMRLDELARRTKRRERVGFTTTTRKQRETIKKIYGHSDEWHGWAKRPPYREFRKGLQPTFGCDGAVSLPCGGMWLCIEKDGYAHS